MFKKQIIATSRKNGLRLGFSHGDGLVQVDTGAGERDSGMSCAGKIVWRMPGVLPPTPRPGSETAISMSVQKILISPGRGISAQKEYALPFTLQLSDRLFLRYHKPLS